ncbi:MAG TPA: flagellar hook-basal body complex protein FliE [Steroidobacteraceae bacterium]|nr:flagellar hook-basal body complex protein FliE [Steroidobacteraceae bacterium]
MSTLEINRVLAEMRALSAQAASRAPEPMVAAGAGGPSDFGALLKAGLDKVNNAHSSATAAAKAFEAGAPNVDITGVMLEVQKAGLAFKAMTEVRNKLVNAYQEIMNMSM